MTAQIAIDFGAVQRDRGMRDALSSFSRGALHGAIVLCAFRAHTFTSEDVRAALSPSVLSQLQLRPNALGAAMHAAARAHLIEPTGMTMIATHAAARKRRLLVWKLKPKST